MEKLAYSVTEVSKMLGISRSYTYDLVKEKRLPTLILGRRIVIPKVQLDRWIEEKSKGVKESQDGAPFLVEGKDGEKTE